MKKFGFFIVLIFSAYLVNSQDFEGGLNVGMTASQVAGDVSSGYNKAGIYAGGFVCYYFDDRNVMLMELNYIQKGSRENPTEDNNYTSYKLNLHYAELPVLYKYIISKHFAVEGGLAYSFFITKKEEYNFQDEVAGKPFNRNNLSFIVGLYYNINQQLRVNIRSNNSILPIRSHASGAKRLFNQGQYNDVLSLGLQIVL